MQTGRSGKLDRTGSKSDLNNAMPVWREFNQQVYAQLHQNLLHQPTRREKQLQIMMQDPVRAPAVLQPKI